MRMASRFNTSAHHSRAAKRAAWFGCLFAAAWCAAVPSANAQIALTFDWSQLGNPTLSGSNVFVVFSGQQSDITIAGAGGTETLQFGTYSGTSFNLVSVSGTSTQVQTAGTWGSAISYDGFVYSTSKAYALATLASSTVTINSGSSVKGFIVYGPSNSPALNSIALRPVLQGGPSPFAGSNNAMEFSTPGSYAAGTFVQNVTAPRYSEFEFSYTSGTGGAGYFDLTNIDQFGGALRMSLLSNSGTQQSSWNVQNAGDQFRGLAALTATQTWAGGTNTYPNGTWQSNPLITTGTAGTGEFVRVIGPSKFPNGAPPADTVAGNTPYGTFNNYLSLLASGSLQATGTLMNLAPGAQPGGQGAIGGFAGSGAFSGAGRANANYFFTPSFTAVNNGTNGTTYSVTLSGSAVFVPTSGTAIAASYPLQIVIGADQTTANPPNNPLLMTNFINQVPGIGQGVYSWTDGGIISLTLSGTEWQQMDADWAGAAGSTIAQKAYGDFAQGMLAGLVGNPTIVSGTAVGAMTSYEWWQNPALAYSGTSGNMSAWGAYVWNNSLVTRPGGSGTFSGTSVGGVYGSVYDDRWSRNTLNSDVNTTTLQITLLPDGDLSVTAVPEPSGVVIVVMGCAGGAWAGWRRRRGKPVA
jgi:hypothetical protein